MKNLLRHTAHCTLLTALLLLTAHCTLLTAFGQDTPGTVKFPTAVDSADSLFRIADGPRSQTTEAMTSSSTSVNVTTTSLFPVTGSLKIDSEVVYYTGKTSSSFTGLIRGSSGTSAAGHVAGAQIFAPILAAHHNTLSQAIVEIEKKIGTGDSPASGAETGAVLTKQSDGSTQWSALDSDLLTIAGLAPSNDDVLQRKAGAWINRTPAQLKVDLAVNNVDNTSDVSKPISTATQTALDGKEATENKSTNVTTDGASNTKYPTVKAAKDYVDAHSISNSAGANVVPKAYGTNLIASRITDSGTDIQIGLNLASGFEAQNALTQMGDIAGLGNSARIQIDSSSSSATVTIDSGVGTTIIGDANGAGNSTKITVDDVAALITIGGAIFEGQVQYTGTPGGGTLGIPGSPYGTVYIGNAATDNIQIIGTSTAPRLQTLPDASGTFTLGGNSFSGTGDIVRQTALDAKVTANGAITGATKTKITYDAKGLVTAGADATTADVADSTDKRYVTDAQRTVLQNTNGTNTGDQTLNGLLPSQTGHSGKFLSTNGTNASWTDGGVITGTGTTNTLPKFTYGASGEVGDSRFVDSGVNITIDSGAGTTTIGDVNGAGNDSKIVIDDSAASGNVITFNAGQSLGFGTTALSPVGTSGALSLGLPGNPFGSLFIGNAATNNIQITGTATGPRVLALANGDTTLVAGTMATQAGVDGKQPLDSDLTTIAGLPATTGNFIVGESSAWASRTPSQVKTTLALDNVTNTSDANKPVSSAQQTALDAKQPLDSDLTTIAGLTATTDNFMVSVSSAWASRTVAQVKSTLLLNNVDNTSDANKPVSTPQQTALNLKANITQPTFLTSASLGVGYLSTTKTVDAAGVTANLLVKINATGNVVNAATSDVSILGVAASTATSGNPVEVATRGIVNCVADNTTVVGNILIAGTSTGGRCRDSGQTDSTGIPITTQVIGKALTVATVGNAVSVQLYGPGHYGAGALVSGGPLGTPSSGVGTNLTGTATGLNAAPNTYNAAGTPLPGTHIVADAIALSAGTVTVTFSGSAVFTSVTTFQCAGSNVSNLNQFKITKVSGTQITLTGTGSDIIMYVCSGN